MNSYLTKFFLLLLLIIAIKAIRGSVTTIKGRVTVNPESLSIQEGGNAAFTCCAEHSGRNLEVRYSHAVHTKIPRKLLVLSTDHAVGQEIATERYSIVWHNKTCAKFNLHHAHINDSGRYGCYAESGRATFNLTIYRRTNELFLIQQPLTSVTHKFNAKPKSTSEEAGIEQRSANKHDASLETEGKENQGQYLWLIPCTVLGYTALVIIILLLCYRMKPNNSAESKSHDIEAEASVITGSSNIDFQKIQSEAKRDSTATHLRVLVEAESAKNQEIANKIKLLENQSKISEEKLSNMFRQLSTKVEENNNDFTNKINKKQTEIEELSPEAKKNLNNLQKTKETVSSEDTDTKGDFSKSGYGKSKQEFRNELQQHPEELRGISSELNDHNIEARASSVDVLEARQRAEELPEAQNHHGLEEELENVKDAFETLMCNIEPKKTIV